MHYTQFVGSDEPNPPIFALAKPKLCYITVGEKGSNQAHKNPGEPLMRLSCQRGNNIGPVGRVKQMHRWGGGKTIKSHKKTCT